MINIIFDVDGTLVDSDDLDGALYWQAVRDVLGPVKARADWTDYTHVSDGGILVDICLDNDIAQEPERVAAVRERFGALVKVALAKTPCPALPGAVAALETLHQRDDVAVGVATGGWGHTAWNKLSVAGFPPGSWPLASSDDHVERTQIMRSCLARLPDPSAPTVYFGDGQWDQLACAALGWGFVGVGARLKGEAPVWIEHYSACDLDQILSQAARAS